MRGRRVRNGDILREEELELLVGKSAQLRAEHIVDADMICIPTVGGRQYGLDCCACGAGVAVKPHSRQIGHGKRGIGIEVVRLDEALKQIPTHLGRFIGARREKGGRFDVLNLERCRGIKWGTGRTGFMPADIKRQLSKVRSGWRATMRRPDNYGEAKSHVHVLTCILCFSPLPITIPYCIKLHKKSIPPVKLKHLAFMPKAGRSRQDQTPNAVFQTCKLYTMKLYTSSEKGNSSLQRSNQPRC